MGFFFWFFCSILVVALVLLLFPFSVRIEFEAGERGARAFFFFFKKKVYEYEKKWGKGLDERRETRDERGTELDDRAEDVADSRTECHPERNEVKSKDLERLETRDDRAEDGSHELSSWSEPQANDRIHRTPEAEEKEETAAVAKRPTETLKTEKMGNEVGSRKSEVGSGAALDERRETRDERGTELDDRRKTIDDRAEDVADSRTGCHPERNEVKSKDPVKSSSVIEVSSTKNSDAEKPSGQASEAKVKKPKPKLSDREFWTILLTPDLDARAFKYALKIIAAVFSLFRIRFSDCFVEGIRSDYVTMGYIAALNGILKAYPFVGDWDLRMDWCHEKELRASGNVRLSITLLRIFCFVLETLVLAGILAFIFWRRRAHVLKTKELPQIGFIRKKIVDFILED